MGVYTYIGKTLGMKVSSNMRKIREQYMQEGTIEKKDFAYLINNAARFDTIKNRLAERNYQVTEDFNDQKFELDDLMGTIITELSCLNYLDLNEKQEYHVKLSRTFMIGGSRLSIEDLMKEVSRYLKKSIQFSLDNREDALAYAMQFARDMSPELADRFVAMWVNNLTLDYGERGREGVRRLLQEGYEKGIIPHKVEVEFVG